MIYLDNGATSMPKPPAVIRAAAYAMGHFSSSGRGGARAGGGADETLFSLRSEAGELFSCPPEHVVLTGSATHGLNIAIKSLVKPGDRVVISGMEHNAVVRPLYALGAEIDVARGKLFDRERLLEAFAEKLQPGTKLCLMTHVSNVFGWILPVEEVSGLCRDRGIPFVLDASQSAGILPVSMEKFQCSFIGMPGHKGLLGPQGTGLLLCGDTARPLIEGGTGSLSRSPAMPEFLPDRLEPGTHNIPGAAGLLAGIRMVEKLGTEKILDHERQLRTVAEKLLGRLPEVELFCGEDQTGVLSFRVRQQDCVALGETIGKRWNIALRAGMHCAPLAHETAGTLDTGTIRVSPGIYNKPWDIQYLAEKLEQTIHS